MSRCRSANLIGEVNTFRLFYGTSPGAPESAMLITRRHASPPNRRCFGEDMPDIKADTVIAAIKCPIEKGSGAYREGREGRFQG